MNNTAAVFIITFFMFFTEFMPVSVSLSAQKGVDNSLYAQLLLKYVKNGVVNYSEFKAEEEKLDDYLKMLEWADTKKMSEKQQFAFYINAYNAWTIKLVLSGYPGLKSIKDMGSFFKSPWEKKICRIDGKIMTLDDIENRMLRNKFKDPRVHFAIVCASKGCPLLLSMPYRGSIIDRQLEKSARAFINNREKNYMKGNTLYVNKIFKWYSEDFNNDIILFFQKFADKDLKKRINAATGRIKIKYLYYDWSLNGY